MVTTSLNNELLSTGQVASLLGSSRQHVVDLCEQGELPCSTTGTHRRVPKRAVELYARKRGRQSELMPDQVRSLWLHRAVAGKVARNPGRSLNLARQNASRVLDKQPASGTERWLRRWVQAIDQGPDAVMEILTSRSPLAREMRQVSPFAGVLTEKERREVLRSFSDFRRHRVESR